MKRYVMVVSRTDEVGRVLPQRIIWGDDASYEIDRILNVEHLPSLKTGVNGLRFHVAIGRSDTYLYFENPRRFVEAKRSDPELNVDR